MLDSSLFTKFRCEFCKACDSVKSGSRKPTLHVKHTSIVSVFMNSLFCVSVLHLHCRPITVFLRVPLLHHLMEALWIAVPQAEGKLSL